MNTTISKRFTGFLILVASWQMSAGCVLADNPASNQQSQQNAVDSSTKIPYSITQQGESAERQVDAFKLQAEVFVKQAESAMKQLPQTFASVTNWLQVQVDWFEKQLKDLSGASPKQSTK